MKEKEKHRIKKEKHVVPVAFNLSAMLRVLTLAASADGLGANDKRDILAVADQTDAVMQPHGGVHCKHPMIGDVDSARALVEGVVTLIDDFAKAHASGVTYNGSRSTGGFVFPTGDAAVHPNSYFGPNFQFSVPDTGTTCSLLGLSLMGLAFLRRKLC
jgi:protein with PEP-CTERM/exosortase system signal